MYYEQIERAARNVLADQETASRVTDHQVVQEKTTSSRWAYPINFSSWTRVKKTSCTTCFPSHKPGLSTPGSTSQSVDATIMLSVKEED